MKVTIRNLGIINEAEIDLKPLTIFVGPNNSGKTWLSYTMAGLLGQYGSSQYLSAYIDEKVKDIYLEAVLWTPEQENPVLTPTQKLMRPAARKRYQTQIDEMYRRINAMGDSKRQEFLGSKL